MRLYTLVFYGSHISHAVYQTNNKKLSYCTQITCQLRTQYVECIYAYSNSMTLISRLAVTGGHWKWHHSKDQQTYY